MRRKITALILAGAMACSVCGLDGGVIAGTDSTESIPEEESALSFGDLANIQFSFSSGAGGWATVLTVRADGSFSGEYFDGEMGAVGEDYPSGTMYESHFSGQFTQPVRVNDYTYSVKISELNYEKEVGTEEIKNDVLYKYSEAYGLAGAENLLIYLPGAPLAELPQEFKDWVGYHALADSEISYFELYERFSTPASEENSSSTELTFYGLYNEEQQCGFSGYNMVDGLKEMVNATEETAAVLENSIQNDGLSQADLNAKTKELYDLWDSVLNYMWNVLKQIKDEGEMSAITEEEIAWISEKEEAVAQSGAEFEGGSAQSMVMNQKAAEMTKERVYELLELFNE